MGKIKNVAIEFQYQSARDELDREIKHAQDTGKTTIHVASRFILLDEALAIQKLLKDSPIEKT
jgi:hypothetical protein